MANFFSKLFSAGATSLVDAVGEAIDKNFTTDEERKELDNELAKAKIQYDLDMANIDLQETQVVLADVASARENQTKIQESEHASWFSKNIHPLLSVVVILLTFLMYYVIAFTDVQEKSENIVIYILGALTTISTQVVAYYFGSSQGSKDKQRSIDGMMAHKAKP